MSLNLKTHKIIEEKYIYYILRMNHVKPNLTNQLMSSNFDTKNVININNNNNRRKLESKFFV